MTDIYSGVHQAHLGDQEFRILNAFKCLRLVKAHIPFQSVVDFGCGIGGWLVAARQLGATRILGIEGEWIKRSKILLDDADVTVADLAHDKINLNRAYDLALSIEVGEHLPEASANSFCDCLVNAANVLVFSAAIPRQGGVDHINEQKPQYWVDKFWSREFVPLEIIRPSIAGEPRMYQWLQQNLIVFINYDLLSASGHLARFALPRRHFYVKYAPM
jgi:hypothetical protein